MTQSANSRKGNRSYIFRMLLYVFVMAFCLCVVFVYYRKLYLETRNNIINSGRINAMESAKQIDMHMSGSIDTIKIAGYTVDNMIREKRSEQEILDYLTEETNAVSDTMVTETTGLYGYINDKYLDGAGWDPGADFNATERPWYIEAVAGDGELVVVDPYVDLDTGGVMITFARLLSDKKSVISIDLSINDLQETINEHVKNGNSYAEFIVNSKGMIIVHSDPELIGTDLYSGTDRLSTAITGLIRTSESGYVYLEDDYRDYLIYAVPLANGWNCISVIDATDDFAQLLRPLMFTILSAIIILAAFAISIYRSEKKSRLAHELEMENERALAANEAKTAFLSNMSHEIRTPVNAILGMNEMILREATEESILGYSQNIKGAGDSLLGIINDVLDFSKIEAGKVEIDPVDYQLSSLINDLVNMVLLRAEKKGLRLETDIDCSLPKEMRGDEMRIKQIITNILTNAVKYTESGKITFSVGCTQIKDDPDNIMLNVSVTDTGIGIKEEDIRRLFSKFERIEEKRNRNIEGTGLGLNITKSLLELMGSELVVKSVYGQGSTFSFSLKQKVINPEPLGEFSVSPENVRAAHGSYRQSFTAPDTRVLVVDDNPMNLVVFQNLVKQTQIEVDTAGSGDEAMSRTKDKRYDMLFIDHMMPGKDGIETLHYIREMRNNPNAETPAVCLTANAISGARDQYIAAGFDDYLTKPIDASKLENLLIRYLPHELIEEVTEDSPRGEAGDCETNGTGVNSSSYMQLYPLEKAGIDVTEGLDNSGTSEAYMTVLKVFADSVSETCTDLERFHSEKDYKNYTIRVHALKSSARIIGAGDLADMAQAMEDAGKRGDVGYLSANHEALLQNYAKLKGPIDALFNETGNRDDEAPVADSHIMKEAYEEIRAASDAMDCDRLEKVFEEIGEYRVPESERELFGKIRDAADKYDYDTITELLGNI